MSKVSIIVPVYKTEKYIHRCVDSILSQTFSDIEVILVDDGSPDRCPEICDEYKSKDSRIQVIHQKNGGVSAARNVGLNICCGEYLIFVDGDDYINEDFVQKMVDVMEVGKDLVCCGYNDISEYGIVKCNDFSINCSDKKQLIQCVINGTGGVLWGKIFRTEIIKMHNLKLDENLFMSEDMIFVLKYIKYISHWAVIEVVLYNYNRLNQNSISSNISNEYLKNYTSFYKSQLECLEDLNVAPEEIEKILNNRIPQTLCMLYEKSDDRRKLTEQIKSIDFLNCYFKIGSQREVLLKLAINNRFALLELYLGLKKMVYKVGRSIRRKIRRFKAVGNI